nr:insulinase family protein [Oculatellaceae cyanobacterium Prado106]
MIFSMRRSLRLFILGLSVCFLVLVGFGRSPALAVTPRHYTELQFPPAPEIRVPEYTEFELSNGLKVYLMEDHELPL